MDRRPLKLAALDFCRALSQTVELAPALEAIGYSRYWVADHPPQPNPQIIVALVAGLTETIRVGTAGIALPAHNPVQAALNFQLLENLFPKRIDAGFCGGVAPAHLAQDLLEEGDIPNEPYEERVERLIERLRMKPSSSPDFPERMCLAPQDVPEIWALGTGPRGAMLAAKHGICFGFSLFHHFSKDDPSVVEQYRTNFRPNHWLGAARTSLAIGGICADSRQRAQQLASEHRGKFVHPNLVGTRDECRDAIATLARCYQMDELVVLDLCVRYEDRLRSHQLFFEAASSIEIPSSPT